MNNKLASIEIKNKSFYIGAVLSFIDSLAAKHTAIDFGRYNRLRYIVGEMLKNRIEKAYPDTVGTINVDLFLTPLYFEVSIRDKGVPAWSDFTYNEDNDLKKGNELRNYIINKWADGFGMEQLGKDGQRIFVRMNILNKISFRTPEPYPETPVLDTDIQIKPVTTYEDALEAIRCIYSEYGYSYSYEKLYYVDSFLDMIKNKQLMSFLAVNAHGQTAGHFALSFSDTFINMPELSTVVTRKEFRGLGLFARFMEKCMEIGKEQGFRAIMGQPVAFHPYSQKAFLRSEFTSTAVLFSYIPSDIESEYNTENQRLDLFASVKILDPDAKSRVYVPCELRDFVEKTYKRLGWEYELLADFSIAEKTNISIENSSSLKSTKIVLSSASEDFDAILAGAVKDAVREKNEMIEMFISMNDSGCNAAYETAKKHGFVFSGILPGSENADYILMQQLIGADCQYDKLVTVGEFEELKNDIIMINN